MRPGILIAAFGVAVLASFLGGGALRSGWVIGGGIAASVIAFGVCVVLLTSPRDWD